MPLYTLPNATTGTDPIIQQLVVQVNAFTPLLLTFVWFVVFLYGSFRQKERRSADYAMWSVVASVSTLLVSLIMTTVTGVLQLGYFVIVIVITIFSGFWLFLANRGGL